MKDYETKLYDIQQKQYVVALVRFGISVEDIKAAEKKWKPYREKIAKKLIDRGIPKNKLGFYFQNYHWDWEKKIKLMLEDDSILPVGIECKGEMEGMMFLVDGRFSIISGPDLAKPLLYIHFIESAPWNLRAFNDEPKYKLVGFSLIKAAIQVSFEKEFKGRLGLCSLPQSEGFYYGKCGMTLGPINPTNGLRWYEMSSDAAQKFLDGEFNNE